MYSSAPAVRLKPGLFQTLRRWLAVPSHPGSPQPPGGRGVADLSPHLLKDIGLWDSGADAGAQQALPPAPQPCLRA